MLTAVGASGQIVINPEPPPPPPTTTPPTTTQAKPPPPKPAAPAPKPAPPAAQKAPQTPPPGVQRLARSGPRTGANSTKRLLDALQPLEALGYSEQEAIRLGFGHFPMAGYATFTDDWGNPRYTPTFHFHEGTDIFAECGTPVRSPIDGTFTATSGGAGGIAAYVRGGGTEYYLAHLKGYPRNVRSGQRVSTGDIIGFNGNSGNAVGGACHVHFEAHPGGRSVNPKPILDRWLSEALAAVPGLIASLEKGRPQAIIATGLTRRLADGRDGFLAAPIRPSRTELMWASSASPSGGSLHLAEAEATSLASEIDWAALARQRQAEAQAAQLGDARARALLVPLTPRRLRDALALEAMGAGP